MNDACNKPQRSNKDESALCIQVTSNISTKIRKKHNNIRYWLDELCLVTLICFVLPLIPPFFVFFYLCPPKFGGNPLLYFQNRHAYIGTIRIHQLLDINFGICPDDLYSVVRSLFSLYMSHPTQHRLFFSINAAV